jgi:hypothetical protein
MGQCLDRTIILIWLYARRNYPASLRQIGFWHPQTHKGRYLSPPHLPTFTGYRATLPPKFWKPQFESWRHK